MLFLVFFIQELRKGVLSWSAQPRATANIASMTNAHPAARAKETGLPCADVCRITAAGKLHEPKILRACQNYRCGKCRGLVILGPRWADGTSQA